MAQTALKKEIDNNSSIIKRTLFPREQEVFKTYSWTTGNTGITKTNFLEQIVLKNMLCSFFGAPSIDATLWFKFPSTS
jgi:hypothetical protein